MKYDKQSEPQGVDPTWLDEIDPSWLEEYVSDWDSKLIAALIAKAGYFDSLQWGNTLER